MIFLLRRAVSTIARWLGSLFASPSLQPTSTEVHSSDYFRVVLASDLPVSLDTLTLYVVGEQGSFWFASLLCPCGCGDTITVTLLKADRPHWTLSKANNRPTLVPSIWRRKGCGSHFFLRGGRIIWCDERFAPPDSE